MSPEELAALPYDEYLKTDHWKQVRSTAYGAAGGRCQLCNSGGEVHAHHRTYDNLGHEKPSDVTVLCAECHAKFHDKHPDCDAKSPTLRDLAEWSARNNDPGSDIVHSFVKLWMQHEEYFATHGVHWLEVVTMCEQFDEYLSRERM